METVGHQVIGWRRPPCKGKRPKVRKLVFGVMLLVITWIHAKTFGSPAKTERMLELRGRAQNTLNSPYGAMMSSRRERLYH